MCPVKASSCPPDAAQLNHNLGLTIIMMNSLLKVVCCVCVFLTYMFNFITYVDFFILLIILSEILRYEFYKENWDLFIQSIVVNIF